MRRLFFAAVVALGVCPLWANSTATTHTIIIKDMKFNPDILEIKPQDRVIWKNEDIVPHTATSRGTFDSKSISPEKTYTFKFPKKGEHPYSCTFHPTMTAKIIVK